jgi:TRAP-type mannitol/chloroaromatic compound transport system substrate-binding protein
MNKRKVLQVGIAVALLAGSLIYGGLQSHRALAQARAITLKIQASWPAGLTTYENLKMFAETVEKLSGGRLKIEHLPAGAIVGAFEVLDATHRGVLDGAHTAAAYWVGKHFAAGLFCCAPGGPLGMDYHDFFGWMYEGGGIELYQELYRDVLKMNVVVFPILPAGPQALGWFKKPIKGWEDFKGLKYRIPGVAADVFKEGGVSVVTLPGAEILPAAERGVIDAAEWVGGIEDMRLGFHNVWKIHYTPSMHEPSPMGELLINKDVWQKLPPDLQEIVRIATKETLFRWFAWFHKQNAEAYRELTEKHGVQVLRTPDEVIFKIMEHWDKIAQREAAKDPFFKKVMESQKQYAALLVPYRLSTWPQYDMAGNHYWKEKVFGKPVQ